MPRFVILEHDHPQLHWDLMLEAGGVLQTWRLARPPVQSVDIPATQLGDHRMLYLDHEGPVSGNRGSVHRWDAGVYTEEADSQADARSWRFTGARVRGAVHLKRGMDACTFRWE